MHSLPCISEPTVLVCCLLHDVQSSSPHACHSWSQRNGQGWVWHFSPLSGPDWILLCIHRERASSYCKLVLTSELSAEWAPFSSFGKRVSSTFSGLYKAVNLYDFHIDFAVAEFANISTFPAALFDICVCGSLYQNIDVKQSFLGPLFSQSSLNSSG